MAKKIKILTSFFPPEKGAASHRILTTAKELCFHGFDVSVITTLANYPTGRLFDGYKNMLFKIKMIVLIKKYFLPPRFLIILFNRTN